MPRRRPLPAVVLAATLVVGCGTTDSASPPPPPNPPGTPASTVEPRPDPPAPPVVPRCQPPATAASSSPALTTSLTEALADPRFAGVTVGTSVWVEGLGEVLAAAADTPMAPASVQKVLTAMGTLSLFEADDTMATEVRAAGPVRDGTLEGDLVLVGGGDPTLSRRGPHSLDTLAAQVRAAGITRIAGGVVADDSRHDPSRRAPGWQDWQQPTYVGPLTALTVDDNRHRADPAYLAEPATGNAELFRPALQEHGVEVDGSTHAGVASRSSAVLASLRSAPVPSLVADMLAESDNETAELLTREAAIETGAEGSTPAGTSALTAALEPLCVPLAGVTDDGSGLSRTDQRSAREWVLLLRAARSAPWWPTFNDGLPLGGRTGTLRNRFLGTAAEANVRAKTGTIIGGRALAGYLTTAGGRRATFAVVVNGPGWRGTLGAIDDLVAALAADRS